MSAWQWNMSPFNISPKSTLRLELIGDNKIYSTYNGAHSGGPLYVPVISVPPYTGSGTDKASLTIANAPWESGSLTITTSSILGVAAIGANGDFGNITIESGTVIANAAGSTSIGIGGTGNGNISIEAGANVTAIGGLNKPAISTSSSGNIYIDPSASVRAYAKDIVAITKSIYTNAAPIVNAYITHNGVENSFESISDIADTPIVCDTSNVVLPKGYTSFAYNTNNGEYTHHYDENGSPRSLIQLLDNKSKVTPVVDLEPVPLYKGTPFTIEYYFNFIDSSQLIQTTSDFFNDLGTPLSESIMNDTLKNDWKNSGIPEGYDVLDISVDTINITNNPNLAQVVYKSTNTPYTIKYYRDQIDPSHLLGSEQGKIPTEFNTITKEWMKSKINDYKPTPTTSTIYKDGLWVSQDSTPIDSGMDLSWNPTDNVLYIIYTPVEKVPVTIHYYTDTVQSEPIKTVTSTEDVHVGTQLDGLLLKKLFGDTWLNDAKPYNYYQNGQVAGNYPTVDLDVDKNIVSVVYTNADVNTYTIEYYKDSINGTLLGTKKSVAFLPVGQSLTAENIAEEMGTSWMDAFWMNGYYSGTVEDYTVIQAPPTVNKVKVVYTAKKTTPVPSDNHEQNNSPTTASTTTPSVAPSETTTTTPSPTLAPTDQPIETPTVVPTDQPTETPTVVPTDRHATPPIENTQTASTETAPIPASTSTTPIPNNLVPTALENIFQVLDDEGHPLGYVKMVIDTEGNVAWLDVDEDGTPLGTMNIMPANNTTEAKKENPKTLDGNIISPFILLGTMTGSVFTFRYYKRKK